MRNYNLKFSVRMDENLKTRVKLLAIKNGFTFTKMLNLLVELGYQSFIKRFEYDEENEVIVHE